MFTGIVLHFILKELGRVKGLRVKNITRLGNNISINFGKKSLTAYLLPNHTHLAIEDLKGEGFYRSFFRGEKVEDMVQNELDRLLIIKMSEDLEIVFELFGRRSDCILLKNREIIHSLKGIKKGRYEVPPPPKGLNILEADKDELKRAILNKENISGLTLTFVNQLRKKNREVIENFVEREFNPTILDDILSPFALGRGKNFSSMNEAVIQYFASCEKIERVEVRRKEILRDIEREIKKFESVIRELSTIDVPDDYRIKGEVLLANINDVKRGMKEVKLQYLNKEFSIILNPQLSPQENAQRYFQLYKKAKRKEELAKREKGKLKRGLEQLKKKRDRISISEDIEKLGAQLNKEKTKKEKEKPSHNFREFTTSNGYKVLVGKNALSNHKLTFSYARPYDIFLHVKNVPGCHTILRVQNKNKIPPMEDIEEAAAIAASFSKMKKASLIPVSYTKKKFVKSGKRLPPGKVILEREKVIYVRFS